MPLDESRRGLSFSPSRALYGSPSRRQRRSPPPSRKPPEPLRRAVADCLSSAAPLHGSPAALSSEAARRLRDYMATPSTIDMAYNVLIEHALAERDRSPAVVPRCVALLKRYLLRYIPKEQTLHQIDQFCANAISECETITNRKVSLWLKSLTQHSGPSTIGSNAFSPSISASNFASMSLVKSLNYIRSLVARHIPKLSFQPRALSGASNAAKQSLPTLSSFLSKSLIGHVSPDVKIRDSPERKEGSGPGPSASSISSSEEAEIDDDNKYIFSDLLIQRWHGEMDQSSPLLKESDVEMSPQDVRTYPFLEVGAASLLVGNMEAKAKDQPGKYYTQNLPDIDQVLQPSSATTASNFASSQSHLKIITASKRVKSGPHQVWVSVPDSTFRPRARPLFQYRHYSEQQPLRLNPTEVGEVIAEVCSDPPSTSASILSASSRLTNHMAQPSTDVAVSVLIKLVIDMYVIDPKTAAPLTQSMLEDMLSSPKVASRTRVFDVILNLGVHAHLLEPMFPEDPPTIEEEVIQESILNNEDQPPTLGKMGTESKIQQRVSSAIDDFEIWLLEVVYKILCRLVQMEEREEIVWASVLSCLFYFACDKGKILRDRLEGLDIRVIKTLLEISREHSWAEIVHCKLICMLTNMFYQASSGPKGATSDIPGFIIEQVDLLGGVEFICLEYSRANSREERRNLFLVLFDYVLHQINEACLAAGISGYVNDEIQPVASFLILADAPEAFYIAVKHGVEGIGQILRSSISAALSRLPNHEHLILLLEKITIKLDATIRKFTRLDHEFSYMIPMTKSYKSFTSIQNVLGETAMRARLSWATLHSLLHSERSEYRHNGYIWLVELLLFEISEDDGQAVWFKIKNFQQHIGVAGGQDLDCSSAPLPICLMCGLLKSRHNFIRWGFLFVLEKLLMRCKLLLDESEPQYIGREDVISCENRLRKANAVIDIMSCSLSVVVQINETDHINILKMCDMLFSQLCLRLPSANGMLLGDLKGLGHLFGRANESFKIDLEANVFQGPLRKNTNKELPGGIGTTAGKENSNIIFETTSMAALLLRGHAIVPMQLVAHVPASLFYWPLIQLAGAATDDIALGVSVGSKGRGNLPGATSDIRAAVLLLLIGKCSADPKAFQEVEGEEFFRGLLDDTDSRVAYYSSAFLLKRMMTEEPEKYQRMLQSLIFKAQQSNNEKLLENPYLQMRGIVQLSNDLGNQ